MYGYKTIRKTLTAVIRYKNAYNRKNNTLLGNLYYARIPLKIEIL